MVFVKFLDNCFCMGSTFLINFKVKFSIFLDFYFYDQQILIEKLIYFLVYVATISF